MTHSVSEVHSSLLHTENPLPLKDGYGRHITYLRLAITDRCNLRCRYCRPEKGVPFIPHEEILTYEELERLVRIFCALGISKIRVTGGEPFSRKGCLSFLTRLKQIDGVNFLHVTTNGVKTSRYLDELADIGIDGINLSLDTIDRKKFWKISRRDYLEAVLQTLHGTLDHGIPLKINSVLQKDTSDEEIVCLAELTKKFPITLRFIERMPFSGTSRKERINNGNLLQRLQIIFPQLVERTTVGPTTARIFSLPNHKGSLGIIEGYSRIFCKTCNKLRITPAGMLKTCLYDNGALNLKYLIRSNTTDQEIKEAVADSVKDRYANGHEAEKFSSQHTETSMAEIGG